MLSLIRNRSLTVGNFIVLLADLVGKPFGTCYEPVALEKKEAKVLLELFRQNGKTLKNDEIPAKLMAFQHTKKKYRSYHEVQEESLLMELEQLKSKRIKDNRHLKDVNENQVLKCKEVLEMKSKGIESEKLIQQLVENSKTFDLKTPLAKDKYIKYKKERHSLKIRLLKATSRSIGEVLWKKTKLEGVVLSGLRPIDSLPMMMYYGNVCPGAKLLVCDTIGGYLVGSILERMQGLGELYLPFIGPTMSHFAFLEYFNFDLSQTSIIRNIDLTKLLAGQKGNEHLKIIEAARMRRKEHIRDEEMRNLFKEWEKKKEIDIEFHNKQKESFETLRQEKVDSILICHKAHPRHLLLSVFPFLKSGGTFVIFSTYVEVLTELKEELQRNNLAIRIIVREYFLRKYQVDRDRTHPEMRMNGASGFIITGTKVSN